MTMFLSKFFSWCSRIFERIQRTRAIIYIESDDLPKELPPRDIIVAREDGDLWIAGLICPCGCGKRLELMLLPEVKPRWKLSIDSRGRPSFTPSIWAVSGCQSHFWIRGGKVIWCQ